MAHLLAIKNGLVIHWPDYDLLEVFKSWLKLHDCPICRTSYWGSSPVMLVCRVHKDLWQNTISNSYPNVSISEIQNSAPLTIVEAATEILKICDVN